MNYNHLLVQSSCGFQCSSLKLCRLISHILKKLNTTLKNDKVSKYKNNFFFKNQESIHNVRCIYLQYVWKHSVKFQRSALIHKTVRGDNYTYMQGFQYFSILPVPHYLQAVLFINILKKIMNISNNVETLLNQEVPKTILDG
jgi:hypothetical protein